ncbi:hypothetical protein [Rhodococcus sp. ARC_M6]|uniref:hypothetical protein n=1 Tax=Rhodococcus sp. ARC_M6 TaxID=2928852 RepID=UPI001FB4FA03|nr:hypothetical protein [Rhodococcus sp. ARC_M6]MCJ0901923.1 hypothetical protein [Rhodococcus sp. ARC_M6]
MLRRNFRAVSIIGALVLTALSTGPAMADETPVTFVVTGGSLTISAPTAVTHLGTHSSNGVVSGPLGEVHVNDARGSAATSGWVASVVSTDFTTASGPPIPASAVSYSAGAISRTGTSTVVSNDPGDLSSLTAAVTATSVTGNNSATWTPTISVTVPVDAVAGAYSATITHSVA